MKTTISSLIILGISIPITASAQQVNTYQVCYSYQERYSPGYYTSNGSYVQGEVYTVKNSVNCETGEVYSSQPYVGNGVVYSPPQRRRVCNSDAGALMGAGLASALSGGGGWKNSGKWNRYSGRNYSSGSWSNSYTNKSGWTMFGAGLGALIYSC